jgi:Tfp pilus assembly protein PilX
MDFAATCAPPWFTFATDIRNVMTPPLTFGSRIEQRGSALISSLMILILIMIIGVTSMSISDIQFKLAGNLQFQSTAMSSSETAVVEAENWLATGSNYLDTGFTTYDSAGKPHLHPVGHLAGLTAPANDVLTMTWSNSNSREAATSTSGNQRYLIELLATNVKLLGDDVSSGGRKSTACSQVNIYRVTSRGVSARNATKFVQTNYSVLSC